MLNLSPDDLSFNLIGDSFADSYIDIFTKEVVSVSPDQELILDAWDYLVLEKNEE